MKFGKQVFDIDYTAEAMRIGGALKDYLREHRKKGLVVGMSGGIDSSVTAALAVHALGPSRVFGVFMPEADSDPESLRLGKLLAAHLGIRAETEDIAPALAALKCYERRNAAVACVIPGFDVQWKFKIVLSNADQSAINFFSVVARAPNGHEVRERLPLDAYLAIVAATNFKQRVRKTVEYHWADRLNYAVTGTPNRLEDDQGFFVKQGDGAADIKPIAHLYKSQVYAMARHLGLPTEICNRQPTTDTYSLPQGQDEFYFKLPYDQFDLCLYGKEHGVASAEVAAALGIDVGQVEHVYMDIDAKRGVARYLHAAPARVVVPI